jgi:hypothetical protein
MVQSSLSEHQILLDLIDNNGFFDMLVDMIPAKLYIAGESGDDFNPKYHKSQGADSKEGRRAAAKAAKRRKLDPTKVESTVEKKQKLVMTTATNNDPLDIPIVTPTTTLVSEPLIAANSNQSRIEALREKLHAKIAARSSQRPAPDQVSKRAARRCEKQRRRDDAKKRKAAGTSKVNDSSKALFQLPSKPVDAAQDLESLDFGKLAGLNKTSDNYLESNKALANLNKKKNLDKMLADATKKRDRLEQLRRSDNEADQERAKSILWKDAIQEADGHRVKDDPTKIKKQIKRRAEKKKKSQKAWKSRVEQTMNAKDQRLEIKNHNVQARKVGGKVGANLSKKKIADEGGAKGDGSGRRRAGFEGRKTDFLNRKKE